MRNITPSSLRLLPCVVAAGFAFGLGMAPAHAQSGSTGTQTPPAEMQRGVPGVDVDLGTRGRAATNGVPGVDVDLQSQRSRTANGVPGVDVDAGSRVAGVGRNGTMRPPIQDRN